MKKISVALTFIVILSALMLPTMFSCARERSTSTPDHSEDQSTAAPDHSEDQSTAAPDYVTDYINDKPTSVLYLHPYERTGNIEKCIEQAVLIADIKILGLSGVYADSTIPLSVYVGEVIESYKSSAETAKYVYIARYGSPDAAVSGIMTLKPGDEIIMFLKAYEGSIKCTEQPVYRGCYDGLFENLYVYEKDGIKYVLPDTLEDFLPSEIPAADESVGCGIINIANINTRQKTVYYFNTIKEYILMGASK